MKTFLIATKNIDKYKITSALIENVLPDKFSFKNLSEAGIEHDLCEKGSILERAEQKANEIWKYLNKTNQKKYFATVGIDDGFSLTKDGGGNPDSKALTDKILNGKYLKENDTIWLKRGIAFCSDEDQQSILTSIPFVFQGNPNNIKRQEGVYSLRYVLRPIDKNQVLSEIRLNEAIQYYLKYCGNDINNLFSKI